MVLLEAERALAWEHIAGEIAYAVVVARQQSKHPTSSPDQPLDCLPSSASFD